MISTRIGIFIFSLFISITGCAGNHEEDVVTFAIDFSVTEGKEREARNYSDIISKHVLKSEPKTLIHEFYFSEYSKNKSILFDGFSFINSGHSIKVIVRSKSSNNPIFLMSLSFFKRYRS